MMHPMNGTRDGIISHRVGSTMSEEPYRCEACGMAFDTEDKLRKHMREQGLVD